MMFVFEFLQEMKNPKEKCIAKLDQQIMDTEVELQKVRTQIERNEQLTREQKQ